MRYFLGSKHLHVELWVGLLVLTLLILIIHLVGLSIYPLLGTTEGRYGEMARKMAESQQWLMPMYTETEPFFGKPPLYFWITSLSIQTFGANEFSVRLPSWIFSVGTTFLTYQFGRSLNLNRQTAALACVIGASSLLGYAAFGKVHIDAVLSFFVALSILYFWLSARDGVNRYFYIAFIATAFAVLTKGPVALIYIALPLILWLLCTRSLVNFIGTRHFWIGLLLGCLITLPWFIIAERTYPGYLEYYLVGEHWQRYLEAGWTGDRYGAGHADPFGSVIIFAIKGLLPWSLLALVPLFFSQHRLLPVVVTTTATPRCDPYSWGFLLSCAAAPLVFFSVAANVVPNYVMPTLMAWSLLMAYWLQSLFVNWHSNSARVGFVVLIMAIPVAKFTQNVISDSWYNQARNQKPLVEAYQTLSKTHGGQWYHYGKRLYSGEFYTNRIHYFNSLEQLPIDKPHYVSIRHGSSSVQLPNTCQMKVNENEYRLFYCES